MAKRRRPLINRLTHFYWRFSRGLTVGVRAVVLDGEGRVFLVKHTYANGWHLPGGGVEAGETLLAGAGPRTAGGGQHRDDCRPPVLHGMYFHPVYSRRDHVTLYVVREFPPDRGARAEPRDRGARVLSARCAAGGHHGRHARAHRRGAGGTSQPPAALVTPRHRH